MSCSPRCTAPLNRHDEAPERRLLELQQLFLDMAVIVETQGEKANDIESHVANACHCVQGGNKELGKAREYRWSSRRWFCIDTIILLLLIRPVIMPITTSFRKS
ncbi:syntaxin-related protein KNOLLE-like [Panicum miliaceum]|uniref:Syntaxin-related protein KNOLLE-like n=1 Tax=Panicum miliaceum TaxID=4540 RepID=A0A3L6Q8Z7_PANMI|nr:syntaxin-related protein KNOLLE-like [Panicum miliaceum]